jgi:broad specificity phosphatase PhoE
VYKFLDRIKEEYADKKILIVAHGGISIPVNCYFNGIPEDDNLLKLSLRNCEIAKYQ